MEQKKKIKDMTPEEKTAYDRENKRRQRGKEKAERAARQIPDAHDYKMSEGQQKAVSDHSDTILKSIETEITVTEQDRYIVDLVACVLFGFENNIIQKVYAPSGTLSMLVGGYFPDAAAHTAVEHVHRFPGILKSATFKQLYDELLERVVKWSNQTHHAYSTPEFIRDVNQAVAGTYIPPVRKPSVAPAPEPIELPASVPSDEEIRDRGRTQLLRQLGLYQSPYVPDDARCYLDGR